MNNTSQIEAPILDNFVSTDMTSHTSVEDKPSKNVDPVTLLHWAHTPVLTPWEVFLQHLVQPTRYVL